MQLLTSSIQTNRNMIKHLIKSISFIFLATLIASCTKEIPKIVEISGSISPVKIEYIILQKETDIERKITKIIDTLKVDSQGNFKGSFTTEPYVYSLVFPNKKNIGLAINENQKLTVTIEG